MMRKTPFKLLKAIKRSQRDALNPSFAKICLTVCAGNTGHFLLKDFKSIGLAETKRCGRKLITKLTEKGEEVLKSLEVVKRGMG